MNAALVPKFQFLGSGSGQRLKVSIERRDSGSRVFFDATSLRPGGYWQPALAQGIDEADAFVLLVGEKGLGPWQRLEYYEAHDKHVKSPDDRARDPLPGGGTPSTMVSGA